MVEVQKVLLAEISFSQSSISRANIGKKSEGGKFLSFKSGWTAMESPPFSTFTTRNIPFLFPSFFLLEPCGPSRRAPVAVGSRSTVGASVVRIPPRPRAFPVLAAGVAVAASAAALLFPQRTEGEEDPHRHDSYHD